MPLGNFLKGIQAILGRLQGSWRPLLGRPWEPLGYLSLALWASLEPPWPSRKPIGAFPMALRNLWRPLESFWGASGSFGGTSGSSWRAPRTFLGRPWGLVGNLLGGLGGQLGEPEGSLEGLPGWRPRTKGREKAPRAASTSSFLDLSAGHALQRGK